MLVGGILRNVYYLSNGELEHPDYHAGTGRKQCHAIPFFAQIRDKFLKEADIGLDLARTFPRPQKRP